VTGAVICVFAKPPVAGRVKTRLIPAVGAAGAASLAGAFLDDLLATLAGLEWARTVVSTTGDLRRDGLEVWDQGGGDLGDRMERMLRRALGEAPMAFAIGTDIPGLPHDHLLQARRALLTHDAVLGPVDDGGFYLLGMRACPAGALSSLPWSRADTLERTADRLRELGMDVALAPAWFDVDVPADLERLAARLDRGQVLAPATARVLRRLRPSR